MEDQIYLGQPDVYNIGQVVAVKISIGLGGLMNAMVKSTVNGSQHSCDVSIWDNRFGLTLIGCQTFNYSVNQEQFPIDVIWHFQGKYLALAVGGRMVIVTLRWIDRRSKVEIPAIVAVVGDFVRDSFRSPNPTATEGNLSVQIDVMKNLVMGAECLYHGNDDRWFFVGSRLQLQCSPGIGCVYCVSWKGVLLICVSLEAAIERLVLRDWHRNTRWQRDRTTENNGTYFPLTSARIISAYNESTTTNHNLVTSNDNSTFVTSIKLIPCISCYPMLMNDGSLAILQLRRELSNSTLSDAPPRFKWVANATASISLTAKTGKNENSM